MGHRNHAGDIDGLLVDYFDPRRIARGSTTFLIGKRGTGKTKLIVDIMAFFRHCSYAVVVCPTVEASNTYASHVPDAFIYKKWKPEIVDNIMAAQQKLSGRALELCPCLLVFDDCLFDPKFAKHVSTRNLYMNGRHANITVLCAGQYMLDLPPAIRTNTDYVFVLADNNRINREKVYRNFGGVFPTFKEFDEVMRQCTADFNCLVLDNKTASNKIGECVAYYKATLGLRYKVGSRELWKYAEQLADYAAENVVPPDNTDSSGPHIMRHQPPRTR